MSHACTSTRSRTCNGWWKRTPPAYTTTAEPWFQRSATRVAASSIHSMTTPPCTLPPQLTVVGAARKRSVSRHDSVASRVTLLHHVGFDAGAHVGEGDGALLLVAFPLVLRRERRDRCGLPVVVDRDEDEQALCVDAQLALTRVAGRNGRDDVHRRASGVDDTRLHLDDVAHLDGAGEAHIADVGRHAVVPAPRRGTGVRGLVDPLEHPAGTDAPAHVGIHRCGHETQGDVASGSGPAVDRRAGTAGNSLVGRAVAGVP